MQAFGKAVMYPFCGFGLKRGHSVLPFCRSHILSPLSDYGFKDIHGAPV
jgi:hypothetical protein